MRKVIATIEARMTSSRLPGKVLMQCCGKPMLELMIERVKKSQLIDDVVVATTINYEDDPVVELCEDIGCHYYRGSELDVLDRVVKTAQHYGADDIVELTGDCPFIDWRHIDQMLTIYKEGKFDFVTNCMERTFPLGFDMRIFAVQMISDLNEKSDNPLDHEHVAIYFPNHRDLFKCYNWKAPEEVYRPEIEVTLDEMGDYKLIKAIFEGLYPEHPDFSCADVIRFIDQHEELRDYVHGVRRTIIEY